MSASSGGFAARTLPLRRALSRARREAGTTLRRPTASRRPLPGFLILGAAKSGTTSLHEYLSEHPHISAPTEKEIHYFDQSYARGDGWYRAHFQRAGIDAKITGESTPYYLFHPRVPELVARDLPNAKLIVILREPIDRAFSQHNHERASGYESQPFERAIALEQERLRGEEERLLGDPSYRSYAHQHHSYLARSRYAEQLERWLRHFEREQLLILGAEDSFQEPGATVATAQEFLGLDLVPPSDSTARNIRSYAPIADDLRKRLQAEFEPHNQRLYELAGREFGWN